jgi:cellobiose-specific phosphotransferase system component IIA
MSGRTEALEALETVYSSVLETMPDEFDSHQLILALAHQHQRLYVQALVTFAEMDYPFMAVHGEIAQRLSHTNLVKKIGERNSEDIFRQVNSASLWRKV